MKYILGVDAGNTKTIALVARMNGQIVGWGRGGCGDIYNAGSAEIALKHIAEAVTAAMKMANVGSADIVSAAFSMAGADWPEDFILLEKAMNLTYRTSYVTVVNDAVGALSAGAVDGWGVAIAGGTGAGVSARSKEGLAWHSSFWQEDGGARSLGIRALRAVYRSELGLVAKTALSERILAFYRVNSVEELLHLFTRRVGAKPDNAALLARTVLDVAESGDVVAQQIVWAEGVSLADYALAAACKVGIANEPFPLILAGSVFKHKSSLLPDAIFERLRLSTTGVTLHKSELEPSAGALILARQAVPRKVSRNLRANLKKSTPPPQVFAT